MPAAEGRKLLLLDGPAAHYRSPRQYLSKSGERVRNVNKWLIPALTSAVGALVLVPASSVLADTTVALPITSFYQVVVDSAHGHLFISQGSSSVNEILVTNLAGQEVTTIGGQDGVTGIALSPDGSTLY